METLGWTVTAVSMGLEGSLTHVINTFSPKFKREGGDPGRRW